MRYSAPVLRTAAASVLLALVASHAGFPVQDMDGRTLGVAYQGLLRGQNITDADVPSHETGHHLRVAYAPAPFLALTAGLGAHRFSVDAHQGVRFEGGYGFAPAFGLVLFTPALGEGLLRAKGAWETQYMRSEDDRGFLYSGFIHNPDLGLLISPLPHLDLALGGRLHWLDGRMRASSSRAGDAFSNREAFRGYLAFTLKSAAERVFLTLEADASPAFDTDWSRGPAEASFRLSVGGLLGWKERKRGNDLTPAYFPEYQDSKRKQKRLADEVE